MMPPPLDPTPEELRAFGLGQCPTDRAAEIEAMLENGADFDSVLASLPDDELLAHLRQAGELTTTEYRGRRPRSPSELIELLRDHPRYRIVRQIGVGGMGAVFLARHLMIDRLVAIKVVLTERADAAFLERFRREVRTVARLAGPHVVAAYDAEEIDGIPFLVMEYVEGESLAERVFRRGPLPIAEACGYVAQAARGLQSAHERGAVHRDIKPHNLMLGRDGTVKILDFGLARIERRSGEPREGLTAENAFMGTPDYLAPEQARDSRTADIRADIYSLGCTLYHLLSGDVPFPGGTIVEKILRHEKDAPPPIRRADLPPELTRVLNKMMAKSPGDRFSIPAEVVTELERFANGNFAPPPVSRRRGIAAVGAMILLIALLLTLRPACRETSLVEPITPKRDEPEEKADLPKELPPTYTSKSGMSFVLVPKGKFWMGGGGGKPGKDEKTIPNDFYLGRYEVTREEWQKVMGKGPPKEEAKRLPAGGVSWDNAQIFLRLMNVLENDPDWTYRLPTNVEWEYSCRGGSMTDPAESAFDFYAGEPSMKLSPDAADFGKEKEVTGCAPVGTGKPNKLGLFDMHGNIWELCDDASGKVKRVVRSGGWDCGPELCRAAGYFLNGKQFDTEHNFSWSSLGFRVARVRAEPNGK